MPADPDAEYEYAPAAEEGGGGGGRVVRPKRVKKAGLSEYFLFTIEGREDIRDKQPRRMVSIAGLG